jgi:hypothetical protein
MATHVTRLLGLLPEAIGTLIGAAFGYAERLLTLLLYMRAAPPAGPPSLAVEPPAADSPPPTDPVTSGPAPIPGFLVASVAAPDGFGGQWPEKDGPSSSDSDEGASESTDSFRDMQSISFSNGRRSVREGSFRKRDAAKLERAKRIRSNCLTSHLVTPAQHNRSVELNRLNVLSAGGSVGSTGCNTVATTPRNISEDKLMQIPEWTGGTPAGGGGGSEATPYKRRARKSSSKFGEGLVALTPKGKPAPAARSEGQAD